MSVKNDNSRKLAYILVAIGAIIVYAIIADNGPGAYDEFAQCLTEKGISMAGTSTCTYCNRQKDMFGNSFKHVTFHDCNTERDWCVENGVDRYPTWVFPDGKKYTGAKNLEYLSSLSGCQLI